MRRIAPAIRFALSSFAAAALCCSFGTASLAEDLPKRKAGLWELKTTMDEGRGPREQSLKICISDDMEANTVRASIAEHKQNCETYDIKKAGEETVVDAKCVFNGRNVESKTAMTGDFAKAFNVKIDSRSTDTQDSTGQTFVVQRTITQVGSYLGDTCGDLQPGEAAGPDGNRVTVQ